MFRHWSRDIAAITLLSLSTSAFAEV